MLEILTRFALFPFYCSLSCPLTLDAWQKSSSSASTEASETRQSVSECSSPTSVSSSSTAGAWSGGEKVNHPYSSPILSQLGLQNQQVESYNIVRINGLIYMPWSFVSVCLETPSTPLFDTVSLEGFDFLDMKVIQYTGELSFHQHLVQLLLNHIGLTSCEYHTYFLSHFSHHTSETTH